MMLKNDNNIAFRGLWANFQMCKALHNAVQERQPKQTGKIYHNLFSRPVFSNVRVSLNTPSREKKITSGIIDAVDVFVKAEPNKESFNIADRIKNAFPIIKPELVSASSGKKFKFFNSRLKKTLEDLAELRQNLHEKIDAFIAEHKN